MPTIRRPIVWVIFVFSVAGAAANAHGATVCAVCGEKILGAHKTDDGLVYHPEHFTCDHCLQPIEAAYIKSVGKNYHKACYEDHIAPYCKICSSIIEDQYRLSYWGDIYHARHEEESVACDFCNRPIAGPFGDGMVEFPDGRQLCGVCGPSAVVAPDTAWALLLDISEILDNAGIVVDPFSVNLVLVEQDELNAFSGERAGFTGFTEYTIGRDDTGEKRYLSSKIYLLEGMPRTQAISTLAHELMHVWQIVEGPPKLDPLLAEGSGNYASVIVLNKIGGKESEYIVDSMVADEDPVYGDGFRLVKSYVEANGLAALLEELQQSNPELRR